MSRRKRTELTSGTPLGPANPRSGVVEALQRRRAGVDYIGARADIGGGGVATITTTTTASFTKGNRHCSGLPRLRWVGFGVGRSFGRRWGVIGRQTALHWSRSVGL
jgi:hypothetical protein